MKNQYDFLGDLERYDFDEFNFIVRSWNQDKVICSFCLVPTYLGALREAVWAIHHGYTYSISQVLPLTTGN